ncbi:MAG: glycoside hydrolase family 13 protein [Clostridia bacterium]|nr:glycoside hydrolase family 13 protein [Clostridia bacterium]
MNYYPFDSRNNLYRSKLGAVPANENLRLRLLLHKDAQVYEAFLRVVNDNDNSLCEIKMTPSNEWIYDYQFFDCNITTAEGLYWYDFRYTSAHGEFFVVKSENSLGIVSQTQGERFQLTVYDKDFTTPDWLKGGLIYQIFPDRFYNSGALKENVPDDRFVCEDWSKIPEHCQNNGMCSLGNDYYGGDLKGVMEKLPYLKELGVSCIYFNPIFEAHSNHRYNTANYEKIDPLLGCKDDLVNLCKEASKQGIKIILDGVFSHTGDDSIYFNRTGRYGNGGAYRDYNSIYHEWFKFYDFPNGYDAWWGVKTLPETNEDNDNFTEYITGENGILRKYLKLGVAGWRLDVADELPDKFLDKLRAAVKSENPNAYILGEVWEDASNKISYGARRKFLRGSQLDSVMNYPFANAILSFIKNGGGNALSETVHTVLENYPKCSVDTLMNHLGTHDTARVLTVLSKNDSFIGDRTWQSQQKLSEHEYINGVKRLKAAAVIQYTLPGVPSLFYGDEAGVQGFGDPFCRATYPWGHENQELISFYKDLGKVRKECKAFVDGDFYTVFADENSIAFTRNSKNSTAFIAVNRGNNAACIALPDEFKVYKKIFGKQVNNGEIVLNECEYCIIYK